MADIIFHHYPQSPVSEKARVGFGIKGLAWKSVEIPRIPPKPDLMPLTGGYRRTPVMQIGADIYCDTQCILRELERRFPEPTFYPNHSEGLVWGLSRWTDAVVFGDVVGAVLGSAVDQLPPEFASDRGRLYFGPDWDLNEVGADLPHILAQLRPQFGWMDQALASGRNFLTGDQPGLADALGYYLVWFSRGRWSGGPGLLAEFPALEAWEARIKAIGHGEVTDMQSSEAIDIAKAAEPATPERADAGDPQNLVPGMTVSVVPDTDGGDPSVTGVVRSVEPETIAILRNEPRVGRVCVHFPRVGYRVTVVK
ncbi:MAG: glutathione S-transferase family protein [Rhodospirillales bacterium]|nr:glutathione S-transferase family protein [Rhodospirillales bacterium]